MEIEIRNLISSKDNHFNKNVGKQGTFAAQSARTAFVIRRGYRSFATHEAHFIILIDAGGFEPGQSFAESAGRSGSTGNSAKKCDG
jgi:hypothetical protein